MTGVPRPQVLRVILVRHAAAARGAPGDAPDDARPLTAEGEAAARRLASFGLLDRASGFYAGPEARMAASLAPAAGARDCRVVAMPALAESAAGGWLPDGAFDDVVRRYFTEPAVAPSPGWEPAREAARRFGAQVDALRGACLPDENNDRVVPGVAVVATGGRAAVAFLADRLGWSPADAHAAWTRLRFPDLAVIDLPLDGAARLVIPFGTLPV